MLRVPKNYVDPLNVALIFLTCGLAHLFPYHLLVFSYAVLGPAHYLTQISWLHDRQYFSNSPVVAPALGILSVFLVVLFFYSGSGHILIVALTLSAAVAVALVFTVPATRPWRSISVAVGLAFTTLVFVSPKAALFVAVLLPTVLHVFVFTAAFMWTGAVRSKSKFGYLSVGALLLCAGVFLIPGSPSTAPSLEGIAIFRPVVAYMHDALGLSSGAEAQLFGFLSFAYTYHYLNWFSKAEVIHWDKIPRQRMLAIVFAYCAILSVYVVNYALGIVAVLLFAHLHVLLELPLNVRTFAAIARGRS